MTKVAFPFLPVMSPTDLSIVELLLALYWETTLISGSSCDPDSGICSCPDNQVQYGGGTCQVEVTACDSVSPCLRGSCHDNYCYVSCSPDCKIEGFVCKNGLCVPECSSSTDCPQGNCTDGGCTPPNGLKPRHLPDDPDCSPDGSCRDLFSKCNLDTGKCECSLGLRYSAENGECEWLIDTACMACDPCFSHDGCFDLNMVCNTDQRVCVCKPGYKLDDTGELCSEDDHTITPIECTATSECSQLPFSVCNIDLGKCQCIVDYCYNNRSCLPDQVDCSSIECPSYTKCINLRCSDNSQCVDAQLTQGLSWFDVQCEASTECTAHSKDTYCYAGYCQCVKNALYLNESCVRGVFCYSNVNCQSGEVCQFSRCIQVPVIVPAIPPRRSGQWGAVLILGLLSILAICCAMYAVYRFALKPKLKRHEEKAIMERTSSQTTIEQLIHSIDERTASLKSKEKRYRYLKAGAKKTKAGDTNTKRSRTRVKRRSSVNHRPGSQTSVLTTTSRTSVSERKKHSQTSVLTTTSRTSVSERKKLRRDSYYKTGGPANEHGKQNTSGEPYTDYSETSLSGSIKEKARSRTKVKQETYHKSKAEAISQKTPPQGTPPPETTPSPEAPPTETPPPEAPPSGTPPPPETLPEKPPPSEMPPEMPPPSEMLPPSETPPLPDTSPPETLPTTVTSDDVSTSKNSPQSPNKSKTSLKKSKTSSNKSQTSAKNAAKK